MQPEFSATPLIANKQLVVLLLQYKAQTLAIYGLYTSRQHQPLILPTMLDFLVKWFAATA